MNKFRRITALLLPLLLLTAGLSAAAEGFPATVAEISKYGNLILSVPGEELLSAGFDLGDILTVRLNGEELAMPLCLSYNDVSQGELVCRVVKMDDADDPVILAINMGDLATSSGIAVKEKTEADPGYIWHPQVAEPIGVVLDVKEKGGYLATLETNGLVRMDQREDYPALTDEEFANFREVTTTGIAAGRLYRSASPIDPTTGRNTYADAAMKKAGIRTVLNMAEGKAQAEAFPGYAQTYYSTCSILFLDMGIDFTAPEFRASMAEAFRFIIAEESPCLIHCKEGKDRSGFAAAVLECLMGASLQEVTEDYMLTFTNLFDVQPGTTKYDMLAEKNIRSILASAFGADITACDLAAAAESYLAGLGLRSEEIAALKARLSE